MDENVSVIIANIRLHCSLYKCTALHGCLFSNFQNRFSGWMWHLCRQLWTVRSTKRWRASCVKREDDLLRSCDGSRTGRRSSAHMGGSQCCSLRHKLSTRTVGMSHQSCSGPVFIFAFVVFKLIVFLRGNLRPGILKQWIFWSDLTGMRLFLFDLCLMRLHLKYLHTALNLGFQRSPRLTTRSASRTMATTRALPSLEWARHVLCALCSSPWHVSWLLSSADIYWMKLILLNKCSVRDFQLGNSR